MPLALSLSLSLPLPRSLHTMILTICLFLLTINIQSIHAQSLQNFMRAIPNSFRGYHVYHVKAQEYTTQGRRNVNVIARLTDAANNPFEVHFHMPWEYSANVHQRANTRPSQMSVYRLGTNVREAVVMPCNQQTAPYTDGMEALYRAILQVYSRETMIPQPPKGGAARRPVTGIHQFNAAAPTLAANAVATLSAAFRGLVPTAPPVRQEEKKEEKSVCTNKFAALDDSDDELSLITLHTKMINVRERIRSRTAREYHHQQQGALAAA